MRGAGRVATVFGQRADGSSQPRSSGHGDAGVATVRHPLAFSGTPPRYDLPPPGLDEHGDQIRAWLGTGPDQEEAS